MALLPITPAPRSYLECQDCGEVLRELTPAEAQRVARAPYDFVCYCRSCVRYHRNHQS